ncbi:cyclin-domain-containing protein [Chlamydoabsidia padenii]|nr:cyclin-domain-containing protein [Chlamydoabsidia padenii]
MQLDIAAFPVHRLVYMVSNLLESIIQTNDALMPPEDSSLTHFHSRAKPNISIYAYLSRILKFTPFSNEALLSLLVYFDRLALKQHYAFNSLNAHRLIITSIVVASKFTSDVFFQNSRYAKVGGLPLLELNRLELELLFLCEFKLHVPLEDLQDYGNQLLLFHTNHTSTCNSSFPLMITPSVPCSVHQPSITTLDIPNTVICAMTTTNTLDKIDNMNTQDTIRPSKSFENTKTSASTKAAAAAAAEMVTVVKEPSVSKTMSSNLNDTTLATKKRKAAYSHQLPLVQKRFCPSPPNSTIHSSNIKNKATRINALLH